MPTAHVFPQLAGGLASKLINLSGDSLFVALSNAAGPITLASSGVQAAKTFADWKANVAAEISGTGYTAGGQLLTGVSVSTTGNVLTLTSANAAWATSTITANQAVFYDSSSGTEQLICFWDFGGSVSSAGTTFTLQINASGIITATAT